MQDFTLSGKTTDFCTGSCILYLSKSQRVQKNWMVKSQRVKYEFSIRYYIIVTNCLPVAKFWAKLLDPKLWLPPKWKIFVFRFFSFFHFSRKIEDEKRKIDFLHFWPNLGDFEGIFHYYLHFVFKIGMLEIKNCLV